MTGRDRLDDVATSLVKELRRERVRISLQRADQREAHLAMLRGCPSACSTEVTCIERDRKHFDHIRKIIQRICRFSKLGGRNG